MVALYSSATRLSFFKFLSVLRRRDKVIGLVSRSSGLSSFQGTATRYLPFSYSRESFTLFKASLSSSVSRSLSSRSVPDFSISQNLFRLLSTSQQDPFLSFHRGSRVNKVRITWDRALTESFSSGAPIQLQPSGPSRAIGPPFFPRRSTWE